MKRIVSTLLLFLLPLVAMQPTLAFHFCGGSFHSAGIGEAGRRCCQGGMVDACPRPSLAAPTPLPPVLPLSCLPCLPDCISVLPPLHLPTISPPGNPPPCATDILAFTCILRI
jgi:hypothetical protein